MVRRKKAASRCKEVPTKEDLKKFKEQILHGSYFISEGLIDQIKLLAEGHSRIIDRLDRIEKENERQHQETRALVNVPNLITLRETPLCLQTC
jgi:acetyl-CoA carboxylase carboxyltransferase component